MTWGRRMYLFDVAHPVPDVVEGLLIGDVIDQHDPLETGSDISLALIPVLIVKKRITR